MSLLSFITDVTEGLFDVIGNAGDTITNTIGNIVGNDSIKGGITQDKERFRKYYTDEYNKANTALNKSFDDFVKSWTGTNGVQKQFDLAKKATGNMTAGTDEATKEAQALSQRQVGINKSEAQMNATSNYESQYVDNLENAKESVQSNVDSMIDGQKELKKAEENRIKNAYNTALSYADNYSLGKIAFHNGEMNKVGQDIGRDYSDFFTSDENAKELQELHDSELAVLQILMVLKDFKPITDEDYELYHYAISFLRLWRSYNASNR